MKTKTISDYSNGFTFSPAYSRLIVTAAGTVGGTGVTSGDAAAYTVANSGTIDGLGASLGISLGDGGSVTNGGDDATALISGATGVRIGGASGAVRNFGAIEGIGAASVGVDLEAGGSIVNGSVKSKSALIEGDIGVKAAGAATVTNFGTIEGAGGTALEFTSGAGDLVIEPGASFIGKVLGDGGDLTLAAGADGALSGLGTNFSGFGQIDVAEKADWTLTGANTIAAGVTLTNAGILINNGALAIDGALSQSSKDELVLDAGSVTDGAADLGGGTLVLNGDGGTLSGLGSASGLHDFGTLKVEGSGWTIDGATTIASCSSLDADDFIFNGVVNNAGSLLTGTADGIVPAGTIVNTGHIINNYSKYYHTYRNNYSVTFDIGGTAIGGGTAVTNLGVIESLAGRGATGIVMADGGPVINGSITDTSALIKTYSNGVSIGGALGSVTNFGTIETSAPRQQEQWRFGPDGGTAIRLSAGGSVINGSESDEKALILTGYGGSAGIVTTGGSGTVQNFGTIDASTQSDYRPTYAIAMNGGGKVTNGSNTDTGATIYGRTTGIDIYGSFGVVLNYGTIKTWTGAESYYYTYDSGTAGKNVVNNGGDAIELKSGGQVVNGSENDRKALLDSRYGISISGGPGAVRNFGTIKSTGTILENNPMTAISLGQGGEVTNGSASDAQAFIYGRTNGVVIAGAAGTVQNFGTIETWNKAGTYNYNGVSFVGAGHMGIDLGDGGLIVNGSAGDAKALIAGYFNGVYASGGTVRNDGTVAATASKPVGGDRPAAIHLESGGTIVNGDSAARIQGYLGVDVSAGAATLTNFGAIAGAGAKSGIGVLLHDDGVIVNGSGTYRKASISGFTGVSVGADATITNFGTIAGTGGTALAFHGTGGVLIVEGGAAFTGKVVGDDSTLELDRQGGAGTIAGIGVAAAGGGFSGFTDIRVASGADWTVAGSNAIAADTTLVNDGTLIATGTLAASGAVAGAGVIDIAAGARLDAAGAVGAGQTIGFAGDGALAIGDAGAFGAGLAGFGQGDGINLTSFAFSAAEKLHFAENAAKTAGTLVVTDGAMRLALTLFGQFTAAGFSVKTDGHSGSIITYTPTATPTAFQLAAPHH
jgi:hypothetical protein